MVDLGLASKMNGEGDFLDDLREVGRARADAWLAENFAMLGQRSKVDLDGRFLRRMFRQRADRSPATEPPANTPSGATAEAAAAHAIRERA